MWKVRRLKCPLEILNPWGHPNRNALWGSSNSGNEFENRDWCLISENDVWFVRMFVAVLSHHYLYDITTVTRCSVSSLSRNFLVVFVKTYCPQDDSCHHRSTSKTRQQRSAVWLQNGGRDNLRAAHLLNPAHLTLVLYLGWIMRLKRGFGRATSYGMLTEAVILNSCKQKKQVVFPHFAMACGTVC